MSDILEVIRGDTPTVRIGPIVRGGVPVDLTGASAVLTVKAEPADGAALITKTGALTTITTANDGVVFVLAAADTDGLAGDYVWDVQIAEADGTITTFPRRGPGVFRVLADVNRS